LAVAIERIIYLNMATTNSKKLIADIEQALDSKGIEAAKESDYIDDVIVSTDGEEIKSVSLKYGAEVFFKRDAAMASDTAGKLDVIKDTFLKSEEHYGRKFDYEIDLDATSPLRDVSDITNSFEQFLRDDNDNLITAMPSRRSPYFNLVEIYPDGHLALAKTLPNAILRRQDAPKTYDMNASIYIWKREVLLNNDTLFLPKTGLYVMDEDRSIDIDCELDFKFVEFLMKEKNANR